MKILVGCEESQAVTIELRKRGFEAFSCDTQECSGGHPEWHLQEDIFDVINRGWDAGIFFPPCTHLAVSGAAHFAKKIADGRQQQGIDFFMALATCGIPILAIENPIGIMSSKFRKPDQIIQPFHFGHPFTKSTCLWLKGLPLLKATEVLTKPITGWENQSFTPDGRYGGFNGKFNTAKERSKTFPGIAKAMAEQWGSYLKQKELEKYL